MFPFPRRRKLADELRRFFGREPHELPIVSRAFLSVDLPNLQIAVDEYVRDHHAAARALDLSSIGA
ncbi:MAG: hypothetical protein NZT92_17465 [Abditibacteriales bacterium]|nr:hypothetical protein [Abditibacteriales bacterium]MDW8367640.1 hypothetical protein [Abditibacteriales bacterium]